MARIWTHARLQESTKGISPRVTLSAERQKSLYRPELDVVRFVAFSLVFLHHALPVIALTSIPQTQSHLSTLWTIRYAGGSGLCLFFTLSAYLICDLLLRERNKTGTVRIGAFYRRRILRIWPLYLLATVIGVVFAVSRHAYHDLYLFLAYVFMMGNWYTLHFGFPTNPMAPLWSISIEEQFYLFWPSIARFFSRGAMYLVCAGMILVSNGWLVYYGQIHAPRNPSSGATPSSSSRCSPSEFCSRWPCASRCLASTPYGDGF